MALDSITVEDPAVPIGAPGSIKGFWAKVNSGCIQNFQTTHVQIFNFFYSILHLLFSMHCCRVSYVEIYNEALTDLLSAQSSADTKLSPPLTITEVRKYSSTVAHKVNYSDCIILGGDERCSGEGVNYQGG